MNVSTHFLCNVCGARCPRGAEAPDREAAGCAKCDSTVRLRSLVLLLSRELFQTDLTLPEFPKVKGIRGAGLSDPPELAARLAHKLDYTNTFLHQPPFLDAAHPPESDRARYDFLVASEVMEHVAPPIEPAFANLARLLKPDGFLLLTVPFGFERDTAEHFPELHKYSLAPLGGRPVLINRRRDGSVEVFEDLVFHGGPGSTLELRLFSQDSLCRLLRGAGFNEVVFFSENVPEFGVEHAAAWSLPIVARKGRVQPPVAEIARSYRAARRRVLDLRKELVRLRGDYKRFVAHHEQREKEFQAETAESAQWVRQVEQQFEERSQWAQQLERDYRQALADFERIRGEQAELGARAGALQKELDDAQAALARLEARRWTRFGRKTGFLP